MKQSQQLPPLDEDLVEHIVYAMENQDQWLVFDLSSSMVVTAPQNPEPDRYLSLPEWNSADGFDLMSRFADRLQDPDAKARLRQALGQGHGVFRAFKDQLAQMPVQNEEWRAFKRHEMEKLVTAWYRKHNRHATSEADEMGDVLMEDFSIIQGTAKEADRELVGRLVADSGVPSLKFPLDAKCLFLLGPEDQMCGLVAYDVDGANLRVRFYGIDAPWRGLGLFRFLIEELKKRKPAGVERMFFDCAGRNMGVASMFDTVGGVRVVSRTLSIPL